MAGLCVVVSLAVELSADQLIDCIELFGVTHECVIIDMAREDFVFGLHVSPRVNDSGFDCCGDCHRVVPLFEVAVVVSDEGTLTPSAECARRNQPKRKEFLRFVPND